MSADREAALDALFADPRLAGLYDALEGERPDLDAHAEILLELGARSVVDVGCGTGTFACLLASRGLDVVAIDPSEAMLAVARRKPGADRVRWVHGHAAALRGLGLGLGLELGLGLGADAATMTGNVAQVFLDDASWDAALGAVRSALRPHGHFVFETRVPEAEAWRGWSREATLRRTVVPAVGPVVSWVDVTRVAGGLVSFRWTFELESDPAPGLERGAVVLTSDSTLRFRSRAEIESSLARAGFVVADVRDAPDRPGQEHVVIARRGG